MAKNDRIVVCCPICKHSHETDADRVVDADRDETVHKKLEDGSLFAFDCPDCGFSMRLSYSFLYVCDAVRAEPDHCASSGRGRKSDLRAGGKERRGAAERAWNVAGSEISALRKHGIRGYHNLCGR